MKKGSYEKTVVTLLWVITALTAAQFLGLTLSNLMGTTFWH
jgi:hypothetical protein